MIGIIISTHGDLVYGLKNTYEMVVGETPKNVSFVSLKENSDIETFKENFRKLIEKLENYDSILVLVDLEGGSPFNVASEYYYKEDFEKPIEIITGVNLPMIIEAISNSDSENMEEFVKDVEKESKEGILRIKKLIFNNDEEEDF